MQDKKNIGFIGFGRMGSALAEGALAAKVIRSSQVMVYDVVPAAIGRAEKNKFKKARSIQDVVSFASKIFLCVKPQQMDAVLNELGSTPIKAELADKCLISVAAGITLARLARHVGDDVSLIRVMPNTPALLRRGMSAMCVGSSVTRKQMEEVKDILKSVGDVVVEGEHVMDAITAVSGSGPAYVFYLAEAMIEGATSMGLAPDLAERLVRKTIDGAGRLLDEKTESPQELRQHVTSPGGTTAAATQEFDARDLKGIINAGMNKARERSIELAKD